MNRGPAGPERRRTWDAPALACVALHAALCLATALTWEPAHDEGTTWDQAVAHLPLAPGEPVAIERLYALAAGRTPHGPAEVLDSLRTADGMHPPAYYLLMNRWIPATGARRVPLALPVFALGVAALFAMRRLAERVAPGRGAGERAMFLLAVSPWLVGHTILARPYAMALAIFLLATASLLRSLADGGVRSRALFALLSVLGLYTIYHYAFSVAWQLALLGAHALGAAPGARRRELGALAVTGAAIALGYAAWVPSLIAHLEVTRAPWYFAGAVAAGEWPREVGHLLSGFFLGEERRALGRPGLELLLVAVGAATLPFAVRSFAGGRLAAEGRASRAFWWTAPLLPALVAGADVWHGTHTLFVAKTGFALPALLALLVVRASHCTPAPVARRALLATWGALAVAANASAIATATAAPAPSSIRRVATHLRERAEPGHLVVVSSPRPTYVYPLLLALRDAGVAEVDVMYAPPELLRAEGVGLAERTGATGLSLVNLVVTYDRSSVWDGSLLRDVARRAREAGLSVSRPGRPSSPGARAERMLWILSPVQVRYFPG